VATFETWSPDQASVRQLVANLLGEGRALIAETASLLGAEARGRAAELRVGAFLLVVAAGALLVGLTVASGAAVAVLGLALPLWAAALLVAAVELALAFVLARSGLARLRRVAAPSKETLDVLERGMRSLRTEAEASAARGEGVSDRAHPPSHRLGEPTA
jgi:hypothetical protein